MRLNRFVFFPLRFPDTREILALSRTRAVTARNLFPQRARAGEIRFFLYDRSASRRLACIARGSALRKRNYNYAFAHALAEASREWIEGIDGRSCVRTGAARASKQEARFTRRPRFSLSIEKIDPHTEIRL